MQVPFPICPQVSDADIDTSLIIYAMVWKLVYACRIPLENIGQQHDDTRWRYTSSCFKIGNSKRPPNGSPPAKLLTDALGTIV